MFVTGVAKAGPAANDAPPADPSLGTCLAACAAKIHVCVRDMEYRIDQLCRGVPECENLGESAVNAGSAMCKACADNSQPNMCPAPAQNNDQGSGGKKPQAKKSGASPAPPNTCAARGGIMVMRMDFNTGRASSVCFTLKGAHEEIEALKTWAVVTSSQIAELRAGNKPVPQQTQTNVQNGSVELGQLQQGLAGHPDQAQEVQPVQAMFRQLDSGIRDLNLRTSNLEDDMVEVKADVNELKRRPVNPPPPPPAPPADKDNFALSLAAYWRADVYKQYGEFQQAPGLEAALGWRLGEANILGRHNVYVQLMAGGGQPGASDYNGQAMYEWHVGAGMLHSGNRWGLGYGLEFLQRRTTSHHDVRSAFLGGYVEPRLYIVGRLYLSVRVGMGGRQAQGRITDKITDKFDMNIQPSLGYQVFSW